MRGTTIDTLRKLADRQQFAALKDACLAEDTEIPGIRILLTLAHAHLGEFDEAEARFAEVLPLADTLDPDARTDLAAVFILRQEIEQAMTHLAFVLAYASDHPLALARMGWCRMITDSPESAEALFARSAAIEPTRIAVWSNLAEIYCRLGQYPKARESIDAARLQLERQAGDLPEAVGLQHRQRLRGLQLQTWIETGQLAEAEHWLEELDERDDEAQTVYWRCLYSSQLAERDHHEEAAEVLREGLKRYPDNITLLRQFAELAQIQGHFMQVMRALNRAIGQDEKNPALWARLSDACLHRFERRAREAAEKAMDLVEGLTPDRENPPERIEALGLQAKNALAQVESQEQNFDAAEKLFREIIDTNPNFLPALRGFGQQQMQRGNIDEAVELYERIKAIDPVAGHTALINARRFPEDEKTLEKLEQAARTPSLEGKVRSGILLQLAAVWEKRKDYDKAFAFAVEANGMGKRFLRYNPFEHRNQCARIRHGFCKALYEHRPDCGVDSTLPVYVLGMPRSGTTLVEQILASHGQIFGAGELGVIPGVIQGLNRWERHVGSGRTYPDCVDDLTPYVVRGIADNVLKELQEYGPDAKHIVDKLPHNFENIGLIKFLFPKARILSVRRDPRDIAISNFFTDYQAKHGGMGFAYDLTSIGEQLADHNLLMHHWHQVFPGQILEVNYEDVVEDLEGQARRMLDYIGVGWEPQVLEFNKLDRPVKTASVWQVRQPIYKTSKAKWMRYRDHLAPLIAGTNARIEPGPVSMINLPEPGFLTDGFALYEKGDLDGAERTFKKMLYHNPDHSACNYMVGEIYLRKNHLQAGIEFIEKALEKAPWKREWSDNLLKAYERTDQKEKAAALRKRYRLNEGEGAGTGEEEDDDRFWRDERGGTETEIRL